MKFDVTIQQWVSPYWHPAVTADAVVFGFDGRDLNILLVQRESEPYKDMWALPGGFMHKDDKDIHATAMRRLPEETNANAQLQLQEVGIYSKMDRDPRQRVISVAFFALVKKDDYDLRAAESAEVKNVAWHKIEELPELAFDHRQIVEDALGVLRQKIVFEPICFELLNDEFTLTQLQNIYLAIMDPKRQNPKLCDRRNFRNKMYPSFDPDKPKEKQKIRYIEKVEGKTIPGKRPADVFRFNKEAYLEAKKNGIRTEFYC